MVILCTEMLDAERFKLASESQLTYRLKWAAWEWLYNVAGCRTVAFEVRLHGPWGPIVDVVAVGPSNTVYAVEIKTSRSDFARDNNTPADVERLRRSMCSLERRIALANQTLVQSQQYATGGTDDHRQETPAYRTALADLDRLTAEQERLRERHASLSTKFHDPRFLAAANFHYIMAPPGVVLAERVPTRWGLLEPTPGVVVPAPHQTVRRNSGIVANIFRSIARSNTTSMMRAYGVKHTAGGPVFPDTCSHASPNPQ